MAACTCVKTIFLDVNNLRRDGMSNIQDRVIKIIAEQLGVEENKVVPAASFVEDLGADSLDTVELVMALEEHFETEIPDEDAQKILTVQDAINYVSTKAVAESE